MPYLTQLATVARRTGYPVTEVSGWRTRGHGPQPAVEGIVCHHTAGWDDLHVVCDGRPGLDGPLSQFWLRHDGRIFVVAAGRCWHNAPSISSHHDNSSSIGIEAENDGRTPWPTVQLDAFHRLCAELCREFGLPASRVKGHKEVQRGKPDPHGISMDAFRAQVARRIAGGTAKPTTHTPRIVDGAVPEFRRTLRLATPLVQGDDVATWQAGARRFVPGLVVDGLYGPASKQACQQVQRAVAIPANGVVNAETWLLTWIWEPATKEKT
ncbi:N-acetylmuramoyl-L-alanine amidase [Planobispora rosea]|uniref:N-acetylmuramoyl-L-alanine amidase n=1 Tax=Planobispora rosea TaxID=35762 RepID=A0A8J3S194_PLARO|nr:peptidoglycan-binding domain-containing protein [Planobispora rosea]GGS87712.1 N-acetylmuramoyl-L-alanine amidase [Planobispora rosea]GIH86681.1 N-acetylmuramoyl-L-alanine amidase [Planobispora rosea]